MRLRIRMALLAVCVATALNAQPTDGLDRKASRIERHRIEGRDNMLFATFATCLTSHNQVVAMQKFEYSRQIKGNFYWGTSFAARLHLFPPLSYESTVMGRDSYRNTVDQDIYKLDGMLFYRLPIIASRLYFRVGAGLGVGYHRIRTIELHDRILPYVNVEAAWILRISKHFEMKFSPTIAFAPSEFSFSPGRLGARTDAMPWLTDAGFSLTFGWRF